MPTFASAGTVVSVVTVPAAVTCGVLRMPSTLIAPPAGVSNSTVPRLPAVTGNPCAGSGKVNDVWPLAGRASAPLAIFAPVSSRMT